MTIAANNTMNFSDEQGMILDSAREFCRDKSTIAEVRALLERANQSAAESPQTPDELASS